MIVDVHSCQRCGKDHLKVDFMLLTNAQDDWKFWAMCPILMQPILLRITE